MIKKVIAIVTIACLLCIIHKTNAQLYINEISPNNETIISDTQGEFDDWIEIYNAGDTAINLADHYFTDDLTNPTKWEIPATNTTRTTVPANGYLLFWADEQILQGEDHVDFSLNSGGETVYLFATDGITLIDSLNYPGVSNDVSFGRSTDGNTQLQYFSAPTPLATNANSVDVLILFSEPSKTFINSLTVSLSTIASNGVLRYTLNGSEPTANSNQYNGAITITNDAVLKAKFFFNNGIISNTVSERYVTMGSSANNISSDLPIILIETYGQTLDAANMQNAFWSVIEPNNNGRAYATDPASFSGKVGMKIRGASSSSFPKKQWRVEVRNEDDSDLDVSLLGMPADSDWVLYAPGRYDRALINNALMYEISRKLGFWAPRTRFVEVYYNTGNNINSDDYWGIYILMENIKVHKDRVNIAKLKPDENSGEELTGGYLYSLNWTVELNTPYLNRFGYRFHDPDFEALTSTQFNYISNEIIAFENVLTSNNWLDPNTGYKNYTDINTWVTPHILKALAKEPDGFVLSFYMQKDKNGLINAGPVWDFDRAINSLDDRSSNYYGWDTDPLNNANPGNVYYWKNGNHNLSGFIKEMVYDPEYETLFIDKWFEWRRDNVLNTNEINAVIDSMANVLNESQVRNFNRWNTPEYTPRYGGFWGEINEMKSWLGNRSAWIDSQFIPNPSFSPLGGTVATNQNINITNPYGSGNIYYTTDGTDPRLSGGAINPSATTYNGSFNITQPGITYVTARIKSGSNWGAICQIAFYVNDNYQDVVINEIHYNPMDVGLIDGDAFEFIELKNKSNNPVNLTGLNFTDGIDYTFPVGSILPANGFVVLADDSLAFITQYGFSPIGNYRSNLSNAGEQVILSDYYGNTIDMVLYDDISPWQINADGNGPSLGLIDANTDNSQAANWGIQNVLVTPNGENTFCDGLLTYNAMIANASCTGSNDGFITGNVSGGNGPYTYQWDNGFTSNTINNLTAGTYTLTLTDVFGCAYSESYEVTQPNALSTIVSFTDQTYYQINDGTASVTVNGGTPPYTYSWSNGLTTASISNLAPGNYSVTITDSNQCTTSETVTIGAVNCSMLSSTISFTNQTYYQTNDGTASVNVTGGTSPYAFSWSNGATTASINNLAPNSYSVDILDAVGCTLQESAIISAIVCNALQVDVNVNHESCFGETDGLLQITNIQSGTSPYSILWSTGITGTVTNNLAGGIYQLQITDSQGCPFNESYTINAAAALSANPVITSASSNTSNDGAIDLTINGGTPPYNYYWSTAATTEDINGLIPANYWVSITDANNCQVFINNLQIDTDCPTSLVQENYPVLTSKIFQVAQFIQSNGMVDVNKQVGFKAGNYIELINDFEVKLGAGFEATIEGCQ